MKHSTPTHSEPPNQSPGSAAMGFSPWQALKSKRISYLALPLIIMATLVEFVILATGWKYQQAVCLPQGMGVTFFGIGPIGATILAVEALKLPLAIWTASRIGWQKAFMLVIGLPLICLLTFQLVKDMAVYEMGTAMAPAGQLLEKASAEETKIIQLNAELAGIDDKKAIRDQKLAALAAKQAKAKAEIEESLKRNEATRQDAISLTDYQKKELSEVDTRQATIIKQFDADAAQLTKAITDLRARREVEVARATTWNVEEARIENAYKVKLADYTNKKTTYEKDLAEYNAANILRRQLMKEPVSPGVPPERETNKILKPTLVAELDTQIKAKETELAAVNNKRRDRVAQVDTDARQVRSEFDRRSSTKREETDKKREELLAALALLAKETAAEHDQINQEFETAALKADGIRAELDECRQRAEGYYEAREASIQGTQVHRIATTVEIVRGLVMGERPVSILSTAKERGDLYTDQISMVRVWVYPVLAFIVAFLPTLMVEIGFSTLFKPVQQRPPHRLGFMGRRMHWLYTRAGRLKILRAERIAREASSEIAIRDRNLVNAQATASKALAEKEAELQTARAALAATGIEHEEQLKQTEEEWVAKFSDLAESLNRAVAEKDALRDFQKSEIDRQVQMRQNAWSDRVTQLRQELDDHCAASEAERTTLLQEQQKKLLAVTEDCKTQVAQARRQKADAELAAVDQTAKLAHDLKEATNARDAAESQLQHQAEALTRQLTQAQEDAARELEKAVRQEKHRFDRQQLEFEKTLRQQSEDFDHRLKQREQELSVSLNARLLEEKSRVEQDARRREAELERELEARALEAEAQWNQQLQQREETAHAKLKQREQQLQAQADIRLRDVKMQAEEQLRRRELDVERRRDAQLREVETRLKEESQQKELTFHAQLRQRDQELTASATAREAELQNQWASDLRDREKQWEQQTESLIRATETRLAQEAQQKEETFKAKARQLEQQLQSQFDARQAELKAQWDQDLHGHEQEWERNAVARVRATESRWLAEVQQKEELFQSKSRQRDEQWQAKLDAVRGELQVQTEQNLRRRDAESAAAGERAVREVEARLRQEMQAKVEAAQAETAEREQELVAQLAIQAQARQAAEKDRDQAKQASSEFARQAQVYKNRLKDVTSLLSGWKSGNGNGDARGNGNTIEEHLVEA